MKKYQIGDIVKCIRTFRTMMDYDSENHYGVVSYIHSEKIFGRSKFDVQWFDGLETSCYDDEIKPFSIRKKTNGKEEGF